MVRATRLWLSILACGLSAAASAGIGPELARRLGAELTPLGATRTGNAEHSIPPWEGGLPLQALGAGERYADPYANDAPRFTIDAAHLKDYQDQLTPGQRAWLERYPDIRLPVYPTRRSYAAPPAYYTGTLRNAQHTYLNEELPKDAILGVPFPAPDDGTEAIWNHVLRWRGLGRERAYVMGAVSAAGVLSLVHVRERARFYPVDAPTTKKDAHPLSDTAVTVLAPDRLAGAVKLVALAWAGPLRAWQKSPGQALSLSTTDAGGDAPVLGAEGAINEDQSEGFSGPPARYAWKLLGRHERFVPYNAYRLHAGRQPYAELLGAHQLKPEATRYELHRLWTVEGRCKPTEHCAYPRRTLYLDEDSWQVLLADLYDRQDRLAMLQEVHTLLAYDQPALLPVAETYHDLLGGRYAVSGLSNAEAEARYLDLPPEALERSPVLRWARKGGPPYQPD